MLMEGYRFGAWRYTVKPKNIFRDNIFLEGGCVTVSLFYKTCIPMCTDKSFKLLRSKGYSKLSDINMFTVNINL